MATYSNSKYVIAHLDWATFFSNGFGHTLELLHLKETKRATYVLWTHTR